MDSGSSFSTSMDVDVPKPEALFCAAEAGDASAFASLPDASLRNDDGRSLLHVAAASGRSEVRRRRTEEDVDSFQPTFFVPRNFLDGGRTGANHRVVIVGGREQVVEILAELGGIDERDEGGWAPIHSAASCGHADVIEILLQKGANVNLTNNGGRTALHYAASKGWLKIAEILISHGAKINVKDKVGCTPLHRAASTGNSELCELLIEEGAVVDAVDKTGQTPLMTAVICVNKQVALLLIRHGADVDIEDKEGYTVLGHASNDLRPALVDAAKAMLEG